MTLEVFSSLTDSTILCHQLLVWPYPAKRAQTSWASQRSEQMGWKLLEEPQKCRNPTKSAIPDYCLQNQTPILCCSHSPRPEEQPARVGGPRALCVLVRTALYVSDKEQSLW